MEKEIWTKKEVEDLCSDAISDHYMLALSHQPYNEEEAKEMIDEWIKEHIK